MMKLSLAILAAPTLLSKTVKSMSTTASIISSERTFTCSDGVKLVAKCWKNEVVDNHHHRPTKKILCLHGWLDNSASFNRLAPLLLVDSKSSLSEEHQQQPMEIVALDFPGHGLSQHKSVDGPPQLLAEVRYINLLYLHDSLLFHFAVVFFLRSNRVFAISSSVFINLSFTPITKYAYYALECIEALEWNSNGGSGGGVGGGGMRTVVGNINANVNTDINSSQTTTATSGSSSTSPKNDGDNDNNKRDNKINLIGHSMGAGVSVVLVAAFPELFESVTLLEGAGPLARNANDCARHLKAACQRRLKSNKTLFPDGTGDGTNNTSLTTARAKVYRNLDAAIEARLDTTRRMPGDQYLSVEAARDMVIRATVEATVAASGTSSSDDMPVTFRHDPRLQWPSLQYYTREQVEAFYNDVFKSNIPVMILTAEDGWPVDSWSQRAVHDILKPYTVKALRGSHHFHADPDTVGGVASEIVKFLKV